MSGYKPTRSAKSDASRAKRQTTARQRFGVSGDRAPVDEFPPVDTGGSGYPKRSPAQQEVSADLGQAAKLKADLGLDPRAALTRAQKQEPLTFESVLDLKTPLTPKPTPTTAATPARTTGAYKPPTKADSFPAVTQFGAEDAAEAVRLMDEDVAYQEQEEAVKKARRDIKDGLAYIAKKYRVDGMQHGSLVVYYSGSKTRKTLDKTLLVENGCPADVVAASYKESKPWEDVRVVDTSRPRKPRDGDED